MKKVIGYWILCSFLLISHSLQAQETVCAVVKIEILQELTLERQAFEATLKIENTLVDKTIENIDVDVLFTDENEQPVIASSDPNNTNADFFIRVNSLEGIENVEGSGSLAGGKSATVKWLIIPAPGSSGNIPSGKLYFVSADFNYQLDGQDDTLSVAPDTIYVKPMPLLSLDYFLPRDVFADNPLTENIVEPIEPFTLGVRVQNNGSGTANQLKIESAQPRIVENELGLLIDFKLLNSYVQDQSVNNSLLIDFGNIPPQEARMGRWNMSTTLSGTFTKFEADFTHADELGGELTSLIPEDAVNTHILIKDVVVDESGRDAVKDFLAADVFDASTRQYDSIKVYESNATTTPVVNQSPSAEFNTAGNEVDGYTLTFNATAGFAFVEVADPYYGAKEIKRVLRSDGKELNLNNVWFSRRYNRTSKQTEWRLSLLDHNTNGEYRIFVGTPEEKPQPPTIQFISLKQVVEGQQLGFLVQASDPDGTLPAITVNNLPSGAVFEAIESEAGLSQSRFIWTPTVGQAGRYDVTFVASDGALATNQNVVIQVNSELDTDGDGLLDSWEIEQFGNLDQDGSGDADGDGVSDYDEFLQGTDPNVADGPLAPVIVTPLNAATLDVFLPEFIVKNSNYDGDFELLYQFELSRTRDFTDVVDAYYAQPEGSDGQTRWRPAVTLEEDQGYFWRVRATTPYTQSPWSQAVFMVNVENQLPSAPSIVAPVNNADISDNNPFLVVDNAVDPDGDSLEYLFYVYADIARTSLLTQAVLAEGSDGTTQWQLDQTLTEGKEYFWQVAVRDHSGVLVETAINRFTVSVDTEPRVTFIVDSTGNERDIKRGDGICATAKGTCTLRAAIDEANVLEGKENIYFNISQHDAGCDAASGVCTIRPETTYVVKSGVNIDGYTQPGSVANTQTADQGLNAVLKIVVHGTRVETGPYWLFNFRDHRGSELKGMAITNTWEGYDYRGGAILVNRQGDSQEMGHKFTGLFIGTDERGIAPVGNLHRSIHIISADDVQIGGIEPADRNLLMTTKLGIYAKTSNRLKIEGNLIGLDITGTTASGMTGHNIVLRAVTKANIGSLDSGGRNSLSGATSSIAIYSHSSNENKIYNNTIGTTVTEQRFSESSRGIYLYDSSHNDIQANVISASYIGVLVRRLKESTAATGNTFTGNYLGINSLGNVLNSGIHGFYIRATNSKIGGMNVGNHNIITNFRRGVVVVGELFPEVYATGNLISGNRIFNNSVLGIDLRGKGGVTANDVLDADLGGNRLQNFPTISRADTDVISGVLNSQPNRNYRIELYANTECARFGYGQGEEFAGYVDVTTDENGNADFMYTNSTIAVGKIVTATATDLLTNDTSEFSACQALTDVGQLTTFVVDTTNDENDQNPGDGFCETASGVCSLRAAIEEANNFAGKERIHFDIPMNDVGCNQDTQVCTIRPAAVYNVFESVVIDGYTQAGSSPNTLTADQGLNTVLKIVVHGEMSVDSGNLSVFGFRDHRGSVLQGMAITNTWVDRDSYGPVISVYRQDDSDEPGHQFKGLFLGTDELGLASEGEVNRSILIQGGANDVHIGGVNPEDRNLMMTLVDGIYIGKSEGNRIVGNLIGTDISGMSHSGMSSSNISFYQVNNSMIGLPELGGRNVLAGTLTGPQDSITLGIGSSNNRVVNNLIGTNIMEQALFKSAVGVRVWDDASNNQIGAVGAGNVISASLVGVLFVTSKSDSSAADNKVQANLIGVNRKGELLASGGRGVVTTAQNTLIGGFELGEGNTIENYNTGVLVESPPSGLALGNRILGNRIGETVTFGIDLAKPYGVNDNDESDSDIGSNNIQNFPVLTAVTSNSISGKLNSEPNQDYRIELFVSANCSVLGHGAGSYLLNVVDVTTDDVGNVDFSIVNQRVPIQGVITATATNLAAGNTSEFSQCFTITND